MFKIQNFIFNRLNGCGSEEETEVSPGTGSNPDLNYKNTAACSCDLDCQNPAVVDYLNSYEKSIYNGDNFICREVKENTFGGPVTPFSEYVFKRKCIEDSDYGGSRYSPAGIELQRLNSEYPKNYAADRLYNIIFNPQIYTNKMTNYVLVVKVANDKNGKPFSKGVNLSVYDKKDKSLLNKGKENDIATEIEYRFPDDNKSYQIKVKLSRDGKELVKTCDGYCESQEGLSNCPENENQRPEFMAYIKDI